MNPAEPELPAPLAERVRRLAHEDALEPHPAAAALRSFDEEPGTLAPRTRSWIEAHLAACDTCRNALRAVPRLELSPQPLRRWAWPLAAAAGWILAAFVAWRSLAPDAREPFVSVHTLVLSSTRGGPGASVPAGARFLRLELVLGEDVALGARLGVRLEDAAGRTVLDEEREVVERNERDWPVLTLDRAALPHGALRLHVRTSSGTETVFELGL